MTTDIAPWVGNYIGIQWRDGGRTREAVDCYGLVRMVLEEHGGLRLPMFDTVSATDLMRVHEEIGANVTAWRKVAKGDERPFDVVQINRTFKHDGRFYVRPVHLGVVVGAGKVLHAEADGTAGVVLADLDQIRPRAAAVWRHESMFVGASEAPSGSPFDCRRLLVEPGSTIADLVALAGIDDASLVHAEVWIGDTRVNRDWWMRVRPKPGASVFILTVPRGGGGLRIAAMVGVIGLAVVATALFGPIAGGLVMGIGMMAINKFLPPPVVKPPSYADGKASAAYSLTGGTNQRRPGGPVPVLLGRHKFTPPSAGQYSEIRGQKVYWHLILELSCGPITDPEIFIGDTPLENYAGVEVAFERGWHPKQIRDRGNWDPNKGYPPGAGALPGDRWRSNKNAGRFVVGDLVIFNGLWPTIDDRAWDVNSGRGSEIFPGDAYEERLDVNLPYKEYEIRASAVGADRITVDFVSPTLGMANSSGGYENYSIVLQIYERPVEASDNWRLVIGDLTMRAGAGGPKETFGSHSWRTAGNSPSKKYDVRVKRISSLNNTVDNQVWSDVRWSAIKTFTDRKAVPDVGVSRLTMLVKASGQLSGVLNNVHVIAQSLGWKWNSTTSKWVWGPTSNPASLARWVMQMPHWTEPIPDAAIDLSRYAKWYEFCDRNKLEYNAYIDFQVANLHDFLGDIGVAGFAAMCRRDNKRSVAIDPVEGGLPVRIFIDSVNCWESTTRDVLSEEWHAVRVNIADETADWTAKEQLIYADGKNFDNSSRILDRTFIGVTNQKQAQLIGRMALAEETLRREVTETITNLQGLSCEVGDIVGFASDDLAVGLARGRIKSVMLGDDGDQIVGVTLSGPVAMESGVSYGVAYAVGGKMTTVAVIGEVGEHDTLIFAQPPAKAVSPEPDAVFSFGEREREIMPLMIRDVAPDDEENVRLTLIALPPTLQQLRTNLPKWESYATTARRLPVPKVTSVLSTAREMILTAQGDLVTQLVLSLEPISVQGIQIVTMVRPSGTTDDYAIMQATNYGNGRVGIIGLEDGRTYDLQVQYTHQDMFPSPPTEILNHRVVGRIDPPDPLQNLRLVVIGPTLARLHWDPPAELDVRFGGRLVIRHSPDMFSAAWERSSLLVSTEVSASLLTITVPLMQGTYMIMTVDGSGNMSRSVASINTDGASLDEFDTMTGGVIVEQPLFLGVRYNVGVQDGALRLLESDFDSTPDIDAVPVWDALGLNVVNGGIYYFADVYDMGEMRRVRLRRRIAMAADMVGDLISTRMLPVSQWPSVSGTVGAPVDVIIEYSFTADDPDGDDPAWSPWSRLDVCECATRALRFRALLFTEDAAYSVSVTVLEVYVEERAGAV